MSDSGPGCSRSGGWNGRWRGHDCGGTRRRGFGCGLGLLALEDGLERIAGFGHLGEVELRLGVDRLPGRSAALAAVLEVLPDLFGLVGFDGTGVGLSGHADCFERVQDWPALDFQFPCQIVDSNFAHPSLFVLLPCALSCSYQPHGGSISIVSVTPEIAEFATQGTLCCVAKAASHGRFRRRYLHRRTPGCR